MARTKVPITVIDLAGNSVAGASVTIQNRATGTNAVLYTTETGATTTNNPATTDSSGRVQAWVDRGSYNANITASGISPYTEPFESAPQADIGKFALYTALPTGLGAADNGTVIRFLADQTNGVEWWLAYRYYQADGITVNPSAYKWEYIGGPQIANWVGSNVSFSTASSVYQDCGCSITVPLAGDYDIAHGGLLSYEGGGVGNFSGDGALSYSIGAATAIDLDAAEAIMPNNGSGLTTWAQISKEKRNTIPNPNSVLALKLRAVSFINSGGGSIVVRDRWIRARPVRVG